VACRNGEATARLAGVAAIITDRTLSHAIGLCEISDGVAIVNVNRPGALNALNESVQSELYARLQEVLANEAVKSIVLAAEGGRAFVAGADIAEFGASPARALELAARMRRVTRVLATAAKPVIAAIRGYSLGRRLLALACDIRIASRDATFGLPEIKLWILPGGGGGVRPSTLVSSSFPRMFSLTDSAQRAFHP
jgi:enoyl-CoA hydratase